MTSNIVALEENVIKRYVNNYEKNVIELKNKANNYLKNNNDKGFFRHKLYTKRFGNQPNSFSKENQKTKDLERD